MDNTKARKLEFFFSAASTLILLGSIAIAVLWMRFSNKYNFEPVLVLLGLLYAAIPKWGNGWCGGSTGKSKKNASPCPMPWLTAI